MFYASVCDCVDNVCRIGHKVVPSFVYFAGVVGTDGMNNNRLINDIFVINFFLRFFYNI